MPGALQHWLWESGQTENQTCLAGPPREMLCGQGRISLYSATVRSATHVQGAVAFAKKHNIGLTHTHLLNRIEYHSNLLANGSAAGSGPAVTIGAGVMHGDLFIVVEGECPTVGAAGGFLAGGGVSLLLSNVRGLAVDNVLEFQARELGTANHYRNQTFFWALRSGGDGTVGVVTQASLRVYPDDPAVVSTVSISKRRTNELFWNEGVVRLLASLRASNWENVPSQLSLQPSSATTTESMLTLYFLNTTVTYDGEGRVQQHLIPLNDSGLDYSLSSMFLTKVSSTL
ncbi:hypothetical protein BBP40_006220 [Aspergillus hancockii]|nr:hypothetical protein BBP40_006220 [Aspergillus hancockii]